MAEAPKPADAPRPEGAGASEAGGDRPAPAALAITGPTASGKTALSLEVAERLDAEIISMDSRQVYRGLDIGTAKASPEQRRQVRHHGLDLVDPHERYSAGRFGRDARRWIAEIRERGRVPLLVGGTGFFLRSLTHPLFAEPPVPDSARAGLDRYLAGLSAQALARWLDRLDPRSAEALAARRGGAGRQRVQRALEVALLTGRSLSWWHRHSPPDQPPLDLVVLVLHLPRDELYRRIDRRVDAMAEAGLFEEVERLLREGYDAGDPGLSATGYVELIPYFRGERDREEVLDEVRRATRRYARRQLTWFRHQLPADAVWLDATRPHRELADEIVRWARERGL